MAVVEMNFLVENLMQLLVNNAKLIVEAKGEAENLLEDLREFNAVLKQAAMSRRENAVRKELVESIRKVVYRAEVATDKFVIEAKLHKDKRFTRFLDFGHYRKVNNVAAEIKDIREKLKEIRQNNAYGLRAFHQDDDQFSRGEDERKPPVVEEDDDVVGFDEEAQMVIDRLLKGSNDLEVIPVVGMPGLGKTTLATKIFKHPTIKSKFVTRVWIYVSQSYNIRELYLSIISIFSEVTKQYRDMPEKDLANVVRGNLEEKKFLIVLDDVWSEDAWKRIKTALPKNENRNRVLLTTRDHTVAKSCNKSPYNLKFLTDQESWILLEAKAFHKDKCPSELERPGQSIARKCQGLPLSIVVIAGALTGKGKTRREWEQVDQSVGERVMNRNKSNDCNKLVGMSYDDLPYELKACYLYLGGFPRGSLIPAKKVIRLWLAEGFIQYEGDLSIEDRAEEYLNDLVNRNLVMVERRTSEGQIKICRVHDMLHEFCCQQATKKEDLFREVKLGGEQSVRELSTYRRLVIHSSVLEFISKPPSGEHVRSFLCFSSENIEIPQTVIANIPRAFPLLRVLDTESIKFSLLCKEFFHLYHLRYIAFSFDLIKVLPKHVGKLWNIQTLIINTQQINLDIQADIWNMPQLRHLHTNTSAKLPTPAAPKTRKLTLVKQGLQTLSTIAPESCTEEIFSRAQNLIKLGIRGNMAKLLEPKKSKLINNVKNLKCLKNLKLINADQPNQKQLRLPRAYIFPIELRKLTLVNTWLEWGDMSVLGKLKNLEVLKLKDNAFKGEHWVPKFGDFFSSLLVLWIEKTDLVSWKASCDHFPILKRLVLVSCDKLEEIPIGLADICSFQVIELKNSTESAEQSARLIQAKKDEQTVDETQRFELSISS